MDKRNYRIKELRLLQKKPYKTIADEYGLTVERVRQIVKEEDKEQARRDVEERYKKKFNENLSSIQLAREIEELSKQDRRRKTVIKRRILVRYLYDVLELPFFQIATLLDRDHTSIRNLYFEDGKR